MKYVVLRRLDGVGGEAGEPLALFKFDPEQGLAERYDRNENAWVDHPAMIDFTGIGGADPYFDITEGEAAEIISGWSGEGETEDVDTD